MKDMTVAQLSDKIIVTESISATKLNENNVLLRKLIDDINYISGPIQDGTIHHKDIKNGIKKIEPWLRYLERDIPGKPPEGTVDGTESETDDRDVVP